MCLRESFGPDDALLDRDVTLRVYQLMAKDAREKGALLVRRDTLLALIRSLQDELRETQKKILEVDRPAKTKLSKNFFWEEVFPILMEHRLDGLTTQKTRELLRSSGFYFNDDSFRVFWHRAAKDGLIVSIQQAAGYPRWRLTQKAIENGSGLKK